MDEHGRSISRDVDDSDTAPGESGVDTEHAQ